jgi:hypothetical protein
MSVGKFIDRARENWRLFKESETGFRFHDRYHRLKAQPPSSSYGRVFNLAGGVALLMAGLSFAWVIFIAGLGLLAGESLILARLFDRSEVMLIKIATRARNLWASLPAAARIVTLLICVSVLGYGGYYLAPWWLGQV